MSMNSHVYWLFGRSGCGKTTIATMVRDRLTALGVSVLLLDGDQLRGGVCADLGFSTADRVENHRRIAEIAKLASQQGIVILVASMAPEIIQREAVSQILGSNLRWVYIDAPLELCIQRDPKGLYKRKGTDMTNYPFDQPDEGQTWMRISTETADEHTCCSELLKAVILDH